MADPAYAAITKARNQESNGNFAGAAETLENYLAKLANESAAPAADANANAAAADANADANAAPADAEGAA